MVLLDDDCVVYFSHLYLTQDTCSRLHWKMVVMSIICCQLFQVIAASGAVKHEDFVEQVKKLFSKLSAEPTTATQLVAKEPAIFTGSEVREEKMCKIHLFFY